jgi:hypothetical protein
MTDKLPTFGQQLSTRGAPPPQDFSGVDMGRESDWTVYIVGDPNCEHSPEYRVYTTLPPIYAVLCRLCHRELNRRGVDAAPAWPKDDPG